MTGDPAARNGAGRNDGSPHPAPGRGGRRRDQAIALGWLVLIWLLLWGDLSWGNLLGGLVVGVAVLVFFPLPPVTFGGRLRLGALLVLVATFAAELVSASVRVAGLAVRPGCRPRSAIVAVRLRVRTDLNLALTAEVISLVPGTLILEVDRDQGVLYVHVFDVRDPEDLAESRNRILTVERRIVRAIGSADEVRQLQTESVDRRSHP
ncbi:Na+/H+ antiporter subunit E [Micromonospora globispora]|uniref:Na+/H+ antiporter subunit E n=1 Tax=Micromonospora globispora TaxID=1450148 RepID=A0A317KCA1_9ACTN|nr:Na+/H+ antiporter subunit E [Micromonospora globispora]PWU51098.1 Na+/H+ antiporter subunit E [Micromonospora globispora]PWU57570.1 Na+/H+ antiporter subunit E [Micromonospora globispora]RQW95663.1 Na+/H+ antiporter subunit E [Micromonospora globispora]